MGTVAVIFLFLGFIHGYVILWLNGYVAKRHLSIPNLWAWHSVFGIACVVLANYWILWTRILFTPEIALQSLAVTFLAAFPGIYIASHIQWLRQNKKKLPRILQYDTITRNGKSKKTG
jgi:hypothetical protein